MREDNTPIKNYILIDYGRHHAHEYTGKKVKMTEQEAHYINYSFALNKAGKRYIKDKKC